MSFGTAITLAVERVVEPVEGMHRAIAGRWFSAVGNVGKPVQLVHDTISGTVYSSIRIAGAAVGAGLDKAMTTRSDRADAVQALANGLWGDRLGPHEERLGIAMGIRDRDGRRVRPAEIGTVFAAATGHVVVLVHGLVNTERVWQGADANAGLLQSLEAHPGLTPVSVRYNSGQKVSVNGERLASLLESLHREWPVPVESIALVGHSMGGLVIRSACKFAETAESPWLTAVSNVVAIGSPHLGAPLEKLVNAVAWGLNVARETRPLADFLNNRSSGIKDLRFGAIKETDWGGVDPDALLVNKVADDGLPASIDHHFVAGVVTSDRTHPVGIAMGDLMVRSDSATGGQRLDPTDVVVIGGVRHSDLASEQAVIDHVLGWLSPSD